VSAIEPQLHCRPLHSPVLGQGGSPHVFDALPLSSRPLQLNASVLSLAYAVAFDRIVSVTLGLTALS